MTGIISTSHYIAGLPSPVSIKFTCNHLYLSLQCKHLVGVIKLALQSCDRHFIDHTPLSFLLPITHPLGRTFFSLSSLPLHEKFKMVAELFTMWALARRNLVCCAGSLYLYLYGVLPKNTTQCPLTRTQTGSLHSWHTSLTWWGCLQHWRNAE